MCVTCGKGFGQKKHLTSHIISVHNLEKKILCTHCKKRFWKAGTLALHAKSIHKGVVYPCNKCEFKATQKGNQARHVKVVHMNIYPVKCDYCEYGCASKHHLEVHVKNKHPTEYFLEQEEIREETCRGLQNMPDTVPDQDRTGPSC